MQVRWPMPKMPASAPSVTGVRQSNTAALAWRGTCCRFTTTSSGRWTLQAKKTVRLPASLDRGVELTLRELSSTLAKHGVTAVSPAIGDIFDPQLHQAMFEASVPGTTAGQIIQVMTE